MTKQTDIEDGFTIPKTDMRKLKSALSKQKFTVLKPGIFLKCQGAVYGANRQNSLLYTTTEEYAELFASILNEWAKLKKENKIFRKLVKELKDETYTQK